MKERRKYRRKLVDARVKIYHPYFTMLDGHTQDLSDDGVFVVTNQTVPITIGEELKMILVDSKNRDIIFNMEVIRVEADGLGLKFIDYEAKGERGSIQDLRRSRQKN